jgi:hypothetical protein
LIDGFGAERANGLDGLDHCCDASNDADGTLDLEFALLAESFLSLEPSNSKPTAKSGRRTCAVSSESLQEGPLAGIKAVQVISDCRRGGS